MLVGHKRLVFVDVVKFAICKTDVVALVKTSPNWREEIGDYEEEELGHVENVKELGSVPDIDPHPVAVGLESHRFLPEQLEPRPD